MCVAIAVLSVIFDYTKFQLFLYISIIVFQYKKRDVFTTFFPRATIFIRGSYRTRLSSLRQNRRNVLNDGYFLSKFDLLSPPLWDPALLNVYWKIMPVCVSFGYFFSSWDKMPSFFRTKMNDGDGRTLEVLFLIWLSKFRFLLKNESSHNF